MKYVLCLGILVFVDMTGNDRFRDTPSGENSAAEAVTVAERAWAKAAVDGDAASMASYMSDDYLEILLKTDATVTKGHWETKGKAEWIGFVRSGRAKYESVTL